MVLRETPHASPRGPPPRRSLAGFARRYEINPLVARLIAITTVLVLTPLMYVAAWVLMPSDPAAAPAAPSVA